MKIFEQIILSGCLCFDIGANIGNKTQEMLSMGAKVICLEPQDGCVAKLHEKFNGNSNVVVVKKASGALPGTGIMQTSVANTLSTMSSEFIEKTKTERFAGVTWEGVQDTEITTLDELIKIYGLPGFCKIDVEGFETEVLKGLHQPIPIVSVEFVPELKEKTFECIQLLNKLGNYKFNYSEKETNEFMFDTWIDNHVMIEFLSKNNDFVDSFGDLYAKLSS